MASTISNIQENSNIPHESNPIKRRKINTINLQTTTTTTTSTTSTNNIQNQLMRWKSPSVQQTYSSKLVQTLRHVCTSSPAPPRRTRAVREAADKVLATSARGRTRWSRAILANRIKLRLKNHKKAKVNYPKWCSSSPTGSSRLSGVGVVREKRDSLPVVDKRVMVLGRLVPGCRKVSFPNLLEEATDYIGALQMQVRAMTALAELLTAAQTSNSSNNSNVDLINVGQISDKSSNEPATTG